MATSSGRTRNDASRSDFQAHECYTVKLLFDGAQADRHYRVWHKATTYMCVLLEQAPSILGRLRVGDTMNVKYFDSDQAVSPEHLETEIRKVKKRNQGRLKGRYLLDLKIRGNQH
jgi:hypothetical protein